MKSDPEYFTVDSAYLKQEFKKEFKIVITRYFMWFRPAFWREFFAAKGSKAKFNCWLDWPE